MGNRKCIFLVTDFHSIVNSASNTWNKMIYPLNMTRLIILKW